ncbi:MAG TPA: hypothetical protein ENH94_02010 [Phycisphaerales bacterium]|nr:hypothetical protein [Phycisphaerales bacterium]
MLETIVNDLVLSEKEFRTVSDLVYKHCGINLHTGKKELVRARLAKRLRLLKIRAFSEYIDYAINDPSGKEFTMLIDSLSTNLTSFFRESQHFDYLNRVFYPAMLQRKSAAKDFRIRAWSAGCSSGEEPYTIAITLLDVLQGQGRWDVKVLATDISTKVLGIAKRGIYEKKRVEPVSPQQKQKYLLHTKVDGQQCYEVSNALREVITFGQLNLMEQWPIQGPIDFIFCRNVMIYFDKQTQQRLVGRYWDLLDSGGVLFTGHSESLTGIEHKFKYVQPTIYAKP